MSATKKYVIKWEPFDLIRGVREVFHEVVYELRSEETVDANS